MRCCFSERVINIDLGVIPLSLGNDPSYFSQGMRFVGLIYLFFEIICTSSSMKGAVAK